MWTPISQRKPNLANHGNVSIKKWNVSKVARSCLLPWPMPPNFPINAKSKTRQKKTLWAVILLLLWCFCYFWPFISIFNMYQYDIFPLAFSSLVISSKSDILRQERAKSEFSVLYIIAAKGSDYRLLRAKILLDGKEKNSIVKNLYRY